MNETEISVPYEFHSLRQPAGAMLVRWFRRVGFHYRSPQPTCCLGLFIVDSTINDTYYGEL